MDTTPDPQQMEALRTAFRNGTLTEVPSFFPLPDMVEDSPHPVSLTPVALVRCITRKTENRVIFVGSVPQGGEVILVRFTVPNHTRVAKQFFRQAGVRSVPRVDRNFDLDKGIPLFVRVEGTLLGKDAIPPIPDEEKAEGTVVPSACWVLGSVKVREATVREVHDMSTASEPVEEE